MNINNLSLEEKIGQLLMVGFDALELNDHIIKAIKEYKIGNVILFTRNIKSAEQVFNLNKSLQKLALESIGIPLFISIDQEGGMVTRIFNDATFFPGNMTLGATNKSDYAYTMGSMMGQELKYLGINMDLAPVLDVNNNPKNPVIGVRSYSDNPQVVAEFGSKFIEGLQSLKVIATGKHFPGHGDTSVDSHLDLTKVPHDKKRLNSVELVPFKKAIKSGIKAIMSAHVLFPAYESEKLPATLSKKVLTDLLKNELEFNGIIVTDCMEMKAISNYFGTENATVMAVNAGANLLCVSHTQSTQINVVNKLKEAILNGEISEEHLDNLISKTLEFKEELYDDITRFVNSTYKETKEKVIVDYHKDFALKVTNDALTLVKGKRFKHNGKVLFIGTEPHATTIADDEVKKRSILEGIKENFKDFEVRKMNIKPDKEIDELVNLAKDYDQIIIATYNANIYLEQAALVNEINKLGKDLHVVSTRNPYDILYFEDVLNYVCLYEYTPNSIKTLVKYLNNNLEINGKLPVL